jgi:Tfp pilus assembly protein PilV
MMVRSTLYHNQQPGTFCRHAGFALFETVLVIGLLALVSAGLLSMQPQVFKAQNNGRDQIVGLELMRACAERLLAIRRQAGFINVTNTSCSGIGGIGGFAINPTVTLKDASNASVTSCSSASCTATIIIGKATGQAASLSPITLQLYSY